MNNVYISTTPEYGPQIVVVDLSLAEEFEDYLDDEVYALYNHKPEPDRVTFYFGLASTEQKVKEIFDGFLMWRGASR